MNSPRAALAAADTGPPSAHRADAGAVRLGERDVAGLLLCGEMYGAPYDLLAGFLGVRPDRLRGIVARWRRAGYVQTARLGPGPAWCWLTRPGLAVTGQRYAPARPALGRLAHIRAVLAVRLFLQDGEAYRDGRAWWRSERRIRAAAGGRVGISHVPDAEVSWPDLTHSAYAGQCWAIEVELTPKPLAHTTAIMSGLLTRTSDYQPTPRPGPGPRYQRVIYLARFTELENERGQITTQLADLAKTTPQAADPALLDALPFLGDLLAGAPARLQQQLYQAFDLHALYNKNLHQVTIFVTTPHALAAITGGTGHDGYPQASPPGPGRPGFSDLAQAPVVGFLVH